MKSWRRRMCKNETGRGVTRRKRKNGNERSNRREGGWNGRQKNRQSTEGEQERGVKMRLSGP